MGISEKIKNLIDSDKSIQSYADFARKAGISKQALSFIISRKTHRPQISTVEKIAAYFNCEVTDIINLDRYHEHSSGVLATRFSTMLLSKKVSFLDISKATGISTSGLSAIKNKSNYSPKPKTLEKLAKYFNVSVAYLIGENE